MELPSFAKRVRYSVQESIVIKIADWTMKIDRPDLCLVTYSLAVGAGVIDKETFKMPPRHKTFLATEYPSTIFDGGIQIEFSVIIEGGE